MLDTTDIKITRIRNLDLKNPRILRPRHAAAENGFLYIRIQPLIYSNLINEIFR